MSTMEVILKNKRFSKESWITNNPILADGELGFESDTSNFKIGDGVSRWNDLNYVSCNIAYRLAGNRKIGNAIFDNTKDITLEDIGALSNGGGSLVGSLYLGNNKDYFLDNIGNGTFDGLTVNDLTIKNSLNIESESITLKGNTFFGEGDKYYINNAGKSLLKGLEVEGNTDIGGNLTTGNILLKENSNIKFGNDNSISYIGDALLNSGHFKSDLEVDGNTTTNGTTYFGGSTHYIDDTGSGVLSALEVTGKIKASGGIEGSIDNAKKLEIAVKLGNALFDGSKGLTASEMGFMSDEGGTFKGPVKMKADPTDSMEIATKQYVDNHTSGASYMTLKGTLGSEGNIKEIPTTNVKKGDTYRCVNAGTYGPFKLQIGDAISALVDSEEGTPLEVNETNWVKINRMQELENFRVKVSNNEASNLKDNEYVIGDIILGMAAAKHVTDNDNKELLLENDDNLVTARSVVNHLKAALGEALDHITGGTVITGTQYFGEDKTYYINETGGSKLRSLYIDEDLTIAGNVNVTGPNCLISGTVTKAKGDINGNPFYSSYAGSLGFNGNEAVLYAKDGVTELSRLELEYAKKSGSTEKLVGTNIEPDTVTAYSLPMLGSGDSSSVYTNNAFGSLLLTGNSEKDGYSKLVLGNDKASGEAGNAFGGIRLYGKGNKYVDLIFEGLNLQDNITVKIPASNGTLITGGDDTSFSAPVVFKNGVTFGADKTYGIDGEGNATLNGATINGKLVLNSDINELGTHYFGDSTDFYIDNTATAKLKSLNITTDLIVDKDFNVKGLAKFEGESQFKNSITADGIFNLNNKIVFKYTGNGESPVEYYINGLNGEAKVSKLITDTIDAKSLNVENFAPSGPLKVSDNLLFGDPIDDIQYMIDSVGNGLFNNIDVKGNSILRKDVVINAVSTQLSDISNIYFAGGKNYYVNNTGDAKFNSVTTDNFGVASTEESESTTTGSVKFKGGIGVEKTVSAKQIRIGDAAVIYYDDDNKCVKFKFND